MTAASSGTPAWLEERKAGHLETEEEEVILASLQQRALAAEENMVELSVERNGRRPTRNDPNYDGEH